MKRVFGCLMLLLLTAVSLYARRTAEIPVVTYDGKSYYRYEVQPKETVYGLSLRFGITQEDLVALNPFLSEGLKIGQTLLIPVRVLENQSSETSQLLENKPEEAAPQTPLEDIRVVRDDSLTVPCDTLSQPSDSLGSFRFASGDKMSVLLLLPLNLDDSAGIHTERYVEFYEGMLMAVDTLRQLGLSFDISVYDIRNDFAGLRNTVARLTPPLNSLVIAAANEDQIPFLSQWCMRYRLPLVLPFSSRVNETADYSCIFQVNQSRQMMAERMLDIDTAVFSGKNILLIRSVIEEAGDNSDYFRALRRRLQDHHIAFREIREYQSENEAMQDSIAMRLSTERPNLVIPAPMSLTDTRRMVTLLGAAANATPKASVSIWGYPEWIALSKSCLPILHQLNAEYFSGYYADFTRQELKDFQVAYSRTFGKDLLNTYPRYAMMGYDIMVHFAGKRPDSGLELPLLQHQFNWSRTSSYSGQYNRALYLVHYYPDRQVKATLLP